VGVPEKPAKAPLPGATYGSFGAACHYKDGTFVFQADQNALRGEEPAERLGVQLLAPGPRDPARVGVVPEPGGVFSGMNPLMRPFNKG
jgi:hypothetical protein